jgi:voltage-gated sodium channel
MGIVRPVMEVYPHAWAFFVPFIIMTSFTILNLFIGIIVSTMQELAVLPDGLPHPEPEPAAPSSLEIVERLEADLAALRELLAQQQATGSPAPHGATAVASEARPG